MSLDKDISKVKKSFESKIHKAPENLWSTISDKLTDKAIDAKVSQSFGSSFVAPAASFDALFGSSSISLDEKISQSFEQTIVAAPRDSWKSIHDKLEVNKVWTEISDKVVVKSENWRRYAAAAIIVVSVSLFPNHFSDESLSTIALSENQSELVVANDNADLLLASNTIEEINTEDYNLSQLESTSLDNQESYEVMGQENFEKNSNVDKIDFTAIEELQISTVIAPIPTVTIEKPKKSNSKFSIGFTGGINRTWVMDNETRSSFDKNSLIDSKLAFGGTYGITAQYDFGKKSAVGMNFMLNSTSKNRIGIYDHGIYKEKVSELRFFKASIYYAHKFQVITAKNEFNIVAKVGSYAAWLKNSTVAIGDQLVSFNDGYKKLDAGLSMQVGPEFAKGNFVFGTGINAELGMRNIFAGSGTLPAELNYTNNLDLGVYFSLKYYLGNK